MTRVVHCKKEDYDVYIGRGRCPKTKKPGEWGNPFVIKNEAGREESIRKYREWIVKQDNLMAKIPSLKNKVLGCWCKPRACHGDVLAELAERS